VNSTDPVLLWALHTVAPGSTGVGRYVAELTTALLARERPLRYQLCAANEGAEPGWLPEGHTVARVRGGRRAVHAAWVAFGWPPIERLARSAALVHALQPGVPVPAKAPSVLTLHDLFPITNPEWYPKRRRAGYRRAVERAEQTAAAVIANSEATRRAAEACLPALRGRVTTVPMGIADRFREPVTAERVQHARERAGIPPGPYVLTLGGIVLRKNHPDLVAGIMRARPDLRLVIVGPDGDGSARLEAAIETARAHSRVTRVRWIPDDDVVALLAGAVALAHAAAAEGFGFTALEAMAAGTPAIVAESAALDEVVGGSAVLVPGSDPDRWAEAFVQVAGDEDLRARLGAAGRAWAARFTWAATADQTAAVHEAVLAP
jgi:glycosyltransferase involved in cell wall biosynthesis